MKLHFRIQRFNTLRRAKQCLQQPGTPLFPEAFLSPQASAQVDANYIGSDCCLHELPEEVRPHECHCTIATMTTVTVSNKPRRTKAWSSTLESKTSSSSSLVAVPIVFSSFFRSVDIILVIVFCHGYYVSVDVHAFSQIPPLYLDATPTLVLHNRTHAQISTPRAADNPPEKDKPATIPKTGASGLATLHMRRQRSMSTIPESIKMQSLGDIFLAERNTTEKPLPRMSDTGKIAPIMTMTLCYSVILPPLRQFVSNQRSTDSVMESSIDSATSLFPTYITY